jgi:hypothetical protein
MFCVFCRWQGKCQWGIKFGDCCKCSASLLNDKKQGTSKVSSADTELYDIPHEKCVDKAKAVPLHATEAFEGRGGIAPAHS